MQQDPTPEGECAEDRSKRHSRNSQSKSRARRRTELSETDLEETETDLAAAIAQAKEDKQVRGGRSPRHIAPQSNSPIPHSHRVPTFVASSGANVSFLSYPKPSVPPQLRRRRKIRRYRPILLSWHSSHF